MKKDTLLKELAEQGYCVGLGAKKNFATYDIVNTIPKLVGLTTLVIGIIQLRFPENSYNLDISTALIVVSIFSLYTAYNYPDECEYEDAGKECTQIFNGLRNLYYEVKDSDKQDLSEYITRKEELMKKFYDISISNQMFLLSDWLGHFKFFYQMQVGWIDEQKNFKFWKDKVPNSAKLTGGLLIIILVAILIIRYI